MVKIWMYIMDAWDASVKFVKSYWVSLLIIAIAIVQIFINKWFILIIMLCVAAIIILVDKFKDR